MIITTPFGKIITDDSFPPDAFMFVNPRYKWIRSEEPGVAFIEVLDVDATIKASTITTNIGTSEVKNG